MQPQHNNNAGGLLTACEKRTRNEEKEGKCEDFREICQLLNLPLVLIGLKSSLYVHMPESALLLDAQGSIS